MNTSGEESEEKLQSEIKKKVEKLKYYVDNADEIIKEGDYNEIKIINSRAAVILGKINTLVANVQELKIDRGETSRTVGQWKKEIKESNTKLEEQIGKLTEAYNGKQQQINEELERQKAEVEREKQERLQHEIREREREMWEEKFEAELKISGVASAISEGDLFIYSGSAQLIFFEIESTSKEINCAEHEYMNMSPSLIALATLLLKMAEKRIEMENKAKASSAKLPKLKIIPFKAQLQIGYVLRTCSLLK